MHALARKKEKEHIMELEALVEKQTMELKNLVKQLSSPIIPVLDEVVVVPLIGNYDYERAEELVINTLNNLPTYKANYLLLDLTGVDTNINSYTVSLIEKIGSAASLIGSETILVGITPQLSTSGINFSRFQCFQTLQHGIYYALSQMGKKIV